MNEPAKQPLELPAATYEPQLSASIDLERGLSSEVLLHIFDLSGTFEVKTCYGDVVKSSTLCGITQSCWSWCATSGISAAFTGQPMNIRQKSSARLRTSFNAASAMITMLP